MSYGWVGGAQILALKPMSANVLLSFSACFVEGALFFDVFIKGFDGVERTRVFFWLKVPGSGNLSSDRFGFSFRRINAM